jgi:hypothetical protein
MFRHAGTMLTALVSGASDHLRVHCAFGSEANMPGWFATTSHPAGPMSAEGER